MKKLFIVFAIVGIAAGASFFGQPRANATADLQAGDLIRGETFSAVYYYGADGFRYVFPNQATYNTWYENFDDVRFISDAQLGGIQIGGNITYRPGTRMIKINTDPRTYAPGPNGTLRHVASEAVAVELYGANWNQMIDDMPDAFFTNYTVGDPINDDNDYSRNDLMAAATSINEDRGLEAPAELSITDSAYSPTGVTIPVGGVVRFTNDGSENHTVTADDFSWGSGTIQPGESHVRQFDEAGTYTFYDTYNSQLTGAIFVQ